MDNVWQHAARADMSRRRIIDLRLAYTLCAAGVDRLATRNVRDFADMGLFEAFDPLAPV